MQNYKRIGLNSQQKENPQENQIYGFNFTRKQQNTIDYQQNYQNIPIQNFTIQNLNDEFQLPNCVVRPIKPKMDRVSSANLSKKLIKNIQKNRKSSQTNNYNNLQKNAEISEQLLKNNNFMNNSDFAHTQQQQKRQTFQTTKNQANKFFNHQKFRDIQTATYNKKNQLKTLNSYNYDNYNNFMQSSGNNDNLETNIMRENNNENYQNQNQDMQIFPDFQEIAEKQRARTANFTNNKQRQKLENLKNSNCQQNTVTKPQQINKVQMQTTQQKNQNQNQTQNQTNYYNFYNYGNNQQDEEEKEKDEYETFKVNKDVRNHFQKFLRPKSQYSFSQCQTAATLTEKNKLGHWSQKNRNNLESAGSNNSRITEFSHQSQISEARKKLKTAGTTGQRKMHTIDKYQSSINNNNKKYRPQTQQQHGRKTLQQRQQELLSLLHQSKNNNQDQNQNQAQQENHQTELINQNYNQTEESQKNYNSSQKKRISSVYQRKQKRTTFQDDQNNNLENQQQYQQSYQKSYSNQNNQVLRTQTSISQNRDTRTKSKQSTKNFQNTDLKPSLRNLQQNQDEFQTLNESESSNFEIKGFDFEVEGITEQDIQYIHQERKKQHEFEKKTKEQLEKNQIFRENVKNKILKNEKNLQKIQNKAKNQNEHQTEEEETENQENQQNTQNELEQIYSDSEDSFTEKIILKQMPDKLKEFNEFYDNDQNIIENLKTQEKQYRKKFEKVKEDDKAVLEEINSNKQADLDFLDGQKFLSFQEIDFIKKEYNRPVNARSYQKLDQIALKLKFFQQFSKQTRIYLLKLANVVDYQSNINIFHQGDEGELMYIIIKGAVHVRIKQEQPDGQIKNPVVVTLYDGSQFGELALNSMDKKQNQGIQKILNDGKPIKDLKTVRKLLEESEKQQQEEEEHKKKLQRLQQEKLNEEEKNLEDLAKEITHQKRAATIQTCEPTILFTISKQQYQSIVVNMMKKDLDDKLKVLKTIQFLDYFTPVQLITLAQHIQVQKYTLGDIILKEGTVPKDFFIIAKGRVKIVKEEIFVRNNELLGQENKQKKFNFGLADYKNVVKNKIYKKHDIAKFQEFDVSSDEERIKEEQLMNKTDQYQKIYQNDQELMFKYQFDFGTLSQSEFFMGRAFLQEYLKIDPRYEKELGKKNVHEKAKLSVIADSAEVEIYKLDKTKIYEIPEMLKKVMVSGLTSKKEYDWEYDDNLEINLNQDSNNKNDNKVSFNQFMMANFGKKWQKVWENYKQQLLQSQIEEKKNKKKLYSR